MNLAGGEILLIVILALIFLGPKKLPDVGRQLGRAIAELRRVSRDFEREVKEAVDPFARDVRATIEPMERDFRKVAMTESTDGDGVKGAPPSVPGRALAPPEEG